MAATEAGIGYGTQVLVSSDAGVTWTKLNDEEKAIITAAAKEVTQFKRQLVETQTAEWLESVKKAGVAVNEISPAELARFAEKTRPVVDKFAAQFGKDFTDLYFTEVRKIQSASK